MIYSGMSPNNALDGDAAQTTRRARHRDRYVRLDWELVMVAKLREQERLLFNLVNDSMFIVYSSRPVSGKSVLQGLGFSDSLEGRTLDIFDELIDSVEDFSVGALPIQIIFPSMLGKDQIHSISSRFLPPPDSSSAMDSRSRRAFLGLRSKNDVSSRAS